MGRSACLVGPIMPACHHACWAPLLVCLLRAQCKPLHVATHPSRLPHHPRRARRPVVVLRLSNLVQEMKLESLQVSAASRNVEQKE